MKPEFSDSLSEKLWDGYFKRVRRLLVRVPSAVKNEVILELEGHLSESYLENGGEREPDRLQLAIEALGDH